MQRIVNGILYLVLKERNCIKDIYIYIYIYIYIGCQNQCSFESITCMQHLPSVPFVLRLFFLQVHQTNIPATARAATDPNTAPTTIPAVSKYVINFRQFFIHDLIIQNLPLYSCYGQETFGIQSELNSSCHNFVFKNSLHIWNLTGCNV